MSPTVSRYLSAEIVRLRQRGQSLLARHPSTVHETQILRVLHDLDRMPSLFAESFLWQALASAAAELRAIAHASFGDPSPGAPLTVDQPRPEGRSESARSC